MSKPILDNLFGSKIRVKLLKFLYRNYPQDFSVTEIAQRIQESAEAVKREMQLLKSITAVKRK
ncbi:MAG TPA: archaellum operon transcriptional activator EarA family protein [Candidatus Paceibacterota bacterium]|nr:archaellum operon transcriptional activator EarA family protein [Candidatus Paceibacterota bacterium]